MSSRRLTLLLLPCALFAFALASRGPATCSSPGSAGPAPHDTSALTATAHVHASVVARTPRHPVPETSAIHARGTTRVVARALPSFVPAHVLRRHARLYSLFGVYRL